jgi:hypothetical protein
VAPTDLACHSYPILNKNLVVAQGIRMPAYAWEVFSHFVWQILSSKLVLRSRLHRALAVPQKQSAQFFVPR